MKCIYIFAPLLEAFKNIVASKSDDMSVEIGGRLMGAEVELL